MKILWHVPILFLASFTLSVNTYAADDLTRPIHVSADGHYLAQPDGQPFFWLADTGWGVLHRLSREEADRYLRDRAEKGFTVIQMMVMDWKEALSTPNRYGNRPLLLISSTRDCCLSSVVYTHAQLLKLGVEAQLRVWEGLGHISYLDPALPESREVYDAVTEFFQKHLGGRGVVR